MRGLWRRCCDCHRAPQRRQRHNRQILGAAQHKKGLRGHSSLLAALDTAIEVTKTDIRSEWNIAKSKDDATGDSYSFKLEVVKIGHDIEGEEITSCVAEYGGSKTPSKKSKSSLGSNQAIALKLIKEQIKTSPHILVDGVR